MLMVGEVSPSSLDAYARGIKQLVTVHGTGAWSIIAQADETLRSEEWALLKEDLDNKDPDERPSSFAKRPWEYIISASAFGAANLLCYQFWYMRVTAPLTGAAKKPAATIVDEIDCLDPGSAASTVHNHPITVTPPVTAKGRPKGMAGPPSQPAAGKNLSGAKGAGKGQQPPQQQYQQVRQNRFRRQGRGGNKGAKGAGRNNAWTY